MKIFRTKFIGLSIITMATVLMLGAAVVVAADDPGTQAFLPLIVAQQNDTETQVINLIAADPKAAAFLATIPNWHAEAYQEDGNLWGADFFDANDDWIGYGQVNIATEEVTELSMPTVLTPEEFQAGLVAVERVVLNDGEVLALLGDPDLWDRNVDFDGYDNIWNVYFQRGLDNWLVRVMYDDERYWVDSIVNPDALSAAEEREHNRNTAIELAYSADGVWDALNGTDDWFTYAENQSDSQWSVSFTTTDTELFFALVDIATGEILQAEAR